MDDSQSNLVTINQVIVAGEVLKDTTGMKEQCEVLEQHGRDTG